MNRALRVIGMLVLGAGCAYAMYHWAYAPYLCIRSIQSIGGTTLDAESAPTSYHAALRARANLDRIARLERHCRTEIRLYTLKAKNEKILGLNEQAVETYRDALEIQPRSEIYFLLGMLLADLGRYDEAVEACVPAVRFQPLLQAQVDAYSEELGRRLRRRLASDAR